ncbi:MAG TPA: hypothetical protein VMZ06_18720, partial [Candidatus Bathyarchaeia archaeon]|nr:hypothetical protein [Candidatus Bathyarchaeia archaeon]
TPRHQTPRRSTQSRWLAGLRMTGFDLGFLPQKSPGDRAWSLRMTGFGPGPAFSFCEKFLETDG